MDTESVPPESEVPPKDAEQPVSETAPEPEPPVGEGEGEAAPAGGAAVEAIAAGGEAVAGAPAAEEAPAPAKRKPGLLARLFGWWFNPETRLGRFNRAGLRWTVGILAVFAAGLLVAYFVLYRPAQSRALQAQAELVQTRQQLAGVQEQLTAAQGALSTAQGDLQNLRGQVAALEAHVSLLRALNDVNNARLNIADKSITAARLSLTAAGEDVKGLEDFLQSKDPATASALQSRLSLAINELNSSPDVASSDLKILADQLTKLETVYFP
jgi:hypothetical protein